MITMYTARTSEIDEIQDAIAEIKEQIDPSSLKKYSGGIIFCHMDFVESGVVAALCEKMPFPVIGMTSLVGADEHGYGLFDLTMTVLTSDEVSFEVGMTQGIHQGNYVSEIDQLFQDVRGKVSEDPSMIFTFMPHVQDVSGYQIVAAMDESCHGIPLWGAISNNIDFNYKQVMTICDGDCLPAGVAMMFVNGPIEPKFIVSSLPGRNISNNRAMITNSEGAILREVNDQPILEYLKDMGVILTVENITTTPMMVYYEGVEEPVALGFYTLFEDGSVLAGGEMPVGNSLAVGSIDAEGVFESAEIGLEQILSIEDRQATLLLPCVTRYVMLAPDQERELRLVEERLVASGKPFMMGFAGGEICPMTDQEGNLHNRFHNYTFCACVL